MDPVTLALAKKYARSEVFKGTPDGQFKVDAAVTTGSPVLTSATANFQSADVGKHIVVGVAGNAILRSTIVSVESSTSVTMADNAAHTVTGKGVSWGTDNGPAFQAALDALPLDGPAVLYVPPGTYLVTTAVSKNFNGLRSVRITGAGTATRVIPATGAGAHAFTIQNGGFGVEIDHLVFHGTPGTGQDADSVFNMEGGVAHIHHVQFLGVACVGAQGGVLRVTGDTLVEHCYFGGSIATADNPVVGAVEGWTKLVVRDCSFFDWGILDGYQHSKTPLGNTGAWVGALGTPDELVDAQKQGVLRVQDCRMDEGAIHLVKVMPGIDAGRIVQHVHVSGVRGNLSVVSSAAGVYARGVRFLTVEDCWFGYNTGSAKRIVWALRSEVVKLRHVIGTESASIIETDANVDYIEIEDCVYATFTNNATASRVVTKGIATVTP